MRDPETLPIEEMAHYLLRKRIELCRPSINVQGNGLRPEEEEEERFRGWVKGQYKQLIEGLGHRMRKEYGVFDALPAEVQERLIDRAKNTFLEYAEHWRRLFEEAGPERERKRREHAAWVRRRSQEGRGQ